MGSAPARCFSEQLEPILQNSKFWRHSRRKAGAPADLVGYKLNEPDLAGAFLNADLQDADLRWSDLWEADLCGANLHRADLRGAMLAHANFCRKPLRPQNEDVAETSIRRTDVTDADFRDADLSGADFSSNIRGLRAEQLAGAKLVNARLPTEVGKFERLAKVEKSSQAAKATFVALIISAVYCWVSIASAAWDPSPKSFTLPIVQTSISIRGFYIVAPIILACLFAYLHLQLQRIWHDLASLPAQFPDGEYLDDKAHPWLLVSVAVAHVPRLAGRRPRAFQGLEYWLSVALAWGVAPATLLLFLSTYDRNDTLGFFTCVAVFLGVTILSLGFYISTARILTDGDSAYRRIPLIREQRSHP